MTTDVIDLAAVLTPVAQPRILEGVYRDDEYERMFNVVKREGPWKGIIANHFETVDEVMATVTGNIPPDHGLTLDDVATAHFRGFFAKNSVCFYPELEDVFYNSRFLAEVRDYWGALYALPHAPAVQYLRSSQHRSRSPSRRRHLPRSADREHPGLVAEHDGQVRALHGLPREDGPNHHLVVPG